MSFQNSKSFTEVRWNLDRTDFASPVKYIGERERERKILPGVERE